VGRKTAEGETEARVGRGRREEIDDPTSPRLRRTRLMIFDIGLLTFLKKGRESRCLGGWGFLLVMGSDQ
jgi:hypothetical protein